MKLTRKKLGNSLDKTLAILSSVFAIVLILYLSLAIRRPIYVFVGVLVFLACITWLVMRKHTSDVLASFSALKAKKSVYLVLNIVFFLFFALSITFLYQRSEIHVRPVTYFFLTALMVGVVATEILLVRSKKHEYFILVHVIIIGVSLAWSQLLIFPSVVGSDPWWHQSFTLEILQNGSIPEGYGYSKLPIFHITIGSTSLITNSSYSLAAMLSVSLLQIICNILFVFLLGKLIFHTKIGLLAGLLLGVGNHHIFMSHSIIPNSLAAVFIPIVIYMLFRMRKRNPNIAISLSILLMITIILTHAITAAAVAIILFVLWAGFEFHKKLNERKSVTSVTLTISILFTIAMFSWWVYASGTIETLADLIKWGFSIDYFLQPRPEGVVAYAYFVPLSEQLFNNLGMFFYFAVSFIGCFYMVSKKYGNPYSFALAFAGMIVLAIGFFSLITGHSVIEHRWWYFSQILLAIPLALAFFLFVGTVKNRLGKASILVVLATSLSFLMIISPIANIDNPTFSPNTSVRHAFTDSELQAADTIFNVWSVEKIGMDRYYINSIYSLDIKMSRIMEIDEQLYSGDFSNSSGSVVLIREEIVRYPFKLVQSTYRLDYDPRVALIIQGFSRVYDCGSVSGFKEGIGVG